MTSETIFEQNLLWYAMIYARTRIYENCQTNAKMKKSNEPREKRSFRSVQLFSTCTCVRAASRSDWNEPLETDLFHSFGCHQPSSSEDFPLFLGTARWEAARWSKLEELPPTFNKIVQIRNPFTLEELRGDMIWNDCLESPQKQLQCTKTNLNPTAISSHRPRRGQNEKKLTGTGIGAKF